MRLRQRSRNVATMIINFFHIIAIKATTLVFRVAVASCVGVAMAVAAIEEEAFVLWVAL